MSERLRVLFFGMPCAFSYAPLAELLASPFAVAAVVVPGPVGRWPGATDAPRSASAGSLGALRLGPSGPHPGLRVLPPPDLPLLAAGQERALVNQAWAQRIPVLHVADLAAPAAVAALSDYRPDVIAVACFPRRLPPAVLALPRLGALNVHPSLLPAGRGPAPLFWAFRLGERRTGVTVHLMTDELDAGDILLQEALEVPEGIAGLDLEEHCAELGGRLLVAAIGALAGGTAARRPKDPAAASYHP
ncbi:MAG: hypothetical protein HYU88_00550, partial [Chloroflexi bacterium]|nr:hypothetical protein [Chloroflexota bacterium]